MKKFLIGIIVVVLLAAATFFGVKFLPKLFNAENKTEIKSKTIDYVITEMVKPMQKTNLYEFNKLHMSEEVIKKMVAERFNGDEQAYKDKMDKASDSWKEDYAVSNIEVLSVEKVGDISEADDETKSEVTETLDVMLSLSVNEVKMCTIKINYNEDGAKKSHEVECAFYKSGEDWYLFTDSEYLLGCFWEA